MTNQLTGYTRLVALYADPYQHSISPVIQNNAFRLSNIDAVYLAFKVNDKNLKESIETIRRFNMLGVNLSMPNKIAAVEYMDELSEAAQLVGAINTIVNENGKLIGHMTDGTGFMESLGAENIQVIDKEITVLGAGGAALAIIVQGALDGVAKINVFNRSQTHFSELKGKFQKISKQTGCQICLQPLSAEEELASAIKSSQLLINCTKVGMADLIEESPLKNHEVLHPDLAVADLIYTPRETQLLKAAQKAGCRTINGLGMLLYQGAASFELWTGKKMPVSELKTMLLDL